jgi:hypothetical protein
LRRRGWLRVRRLGGCLRTQRRKATSSGARRSCSIVGYSAAGVYHAVALRTDQFDILARAALLARPAMMARQLTVLEPPAAQRTGNGRFGHDVKDGACL